MSRGPQGQTNSSNVADGILWVGDSIGVGVQHFINLPNVTFDNRVGRASPEGIQIVKAKLSSEHGVIVFDLGGNDGTANIFRESINELDRTMGNRHVVMAYLGPGIPEPDAKNNILQAFGQNPNVHLLSLPDELISQPGAIHPTPDGYRRRAELFTEAIQNLEGVEASDPGTDPSSTAGGGGLSSLASEDIFAVGRAAAISTALELPGLLNYEAAMLLKGDKSIYNDQPLLPFIQQLAQASLRQFQSLPNGSFFAFFPDYFGAYNHRKPYWEIDDIEIVDGSISLNDEPLATHVFVVGDTIPDGDITIPEMISSKGVVTVFDAFASAFMFDADKASEALSNKKQKLINRAKTSQFLKRYGVRPHYEEATFVRNPMFEVFYAFTQFQLMWSRQFVTQFSLTFMPELYPGGIVAFPKHNVRCYVDSVTHTFDYTSGFVTEVNLSAPAAYGRGASGVSDGMIRALTEEELESLEHAATNN